MKKKWILILFLFLMFLWLYIRPHFIRDVLSQTINPIKYDHGIPNIIFRTYPNLETSFVHKKYCQDKWIQLNPGFSHVWYTNKHVDAFMKKYYPGEILDAYNTLRPGAYKADLWRLCMLYKFGGIYVDAYATPCVSIKEMLKGCYNQGKDQFISVLDCPFSQAGIHNGFIISTPKHPFLKKGISDIVENVRNRYYGNCSLAPTGPLALLKSIQSVTEKKCKIGKNECGSLSYHLYDFHWGPSQNIFKGTECIISKSYSFIYYMYRKLKPSAYSIMWRRKQVYAEESSRPEKPKNIS